MRIRCWRYSKTCRSLHDQGSSRCLLQPVYMKNNIQHLDLLWYIIQNPIFTLHTAWLGNQKNKTAQYYFDPKILVKYNLFQTLYAISVKKLIVMYAMTCFKYKVYVYGSETITYLNALLWVVTGSALWVIKMPQTPIKDSSLPFCIAATSPIWKTTLVWLNYR